MSSTLSDLKRLFYQYLLLLVIYGLCRLGFIFINLPVFNQLNPVKIFSLVLWGIRYDVSAIMILNSLYGIMLLMPLSIMKRNGFRTFLNQFFLLTNTTALLFEIGDWAYFPYNFKRSTASVFDLIFRKGDFLNLLPAWIIQYWYLPLIAILFIFLFIRINKRILHSTLLPPFIHQDSSKGSYLRKLVILILFCALSLVGIRGGLQYIPIGVRNAVQTSGSEYAPAILNTPFSILTTLNAEPIQETKFLSEEELSRYVKPIKHYAGRKFISKNVVVIVLESFSKEFTSLSGGVSYTPFLDSIMTQSLVCTNAFANALHSSEGIPAILAGIPPLMDEPMHTSPFGANRINGLAGILKSRAYSSAFYHGGTNGTMAFDGFAPAAGFESYFGRNEYNNEKDHDGNWGIWDEPFLNYVAKNLNQTPQPFVAAAFTLTSHPPYNIPKKYADKIPEGKIPIHKCIRYTDFALSMFFKAISGQSWFQNTLFVITADHTSPQSEGGYWTSMTGRYAIPILFYAPGDSTLRGKYNNLTQQIDILPSILDYLGYEKPFFAMGNSIFDKKISGSTIINQLNGIHTVFNDKYALVLQEITPIALYNLQEDMQCKTNILPIKNNEAESELLPRLKAILQIYRNSLLQNKMWAK